MLSISNLPDLDKLAACAHCDHVAVIRHPDLVHVLVVIFVTSSVSPGANLKQKCAYKILAPTEAQGFTISVCVEVL